VHLSAVKSARVYKKLNKQLAGTKRARRRFVRTSLITANLGILVAVGFFVAGSTGPGDVSSSGQANAAIGSSNDAASGPLDQLSSVDIAVNVARSTGLAESVAVTNQSDSASITNTVASADTAVIAKPQLVATSNKSVNDIQTYVAVAGDTIASVAAKFNVTSESIRWSNSLTKEAIPAGTKLIIPPINGIVYTVKAGDTADSLAQRYGSTKDKIIAFNDAEVSGLVVGKQIVIPGGQAPVTAPRSGVVRGFSWGTVPIYGYNGYDYGYCTWYVANKRIQIGRPLPANLGNAYTWDDRAPQGYDHHPAVGAAVVTNTSRNPGHVAFVEVVNDDGSIWISEMNSRGQRSITDPTSAGGWGHIDYKLVPAAQAASYSYIH
jgi:surface antigen/LysM repeat protein